MLEIGLLTKEQCWEKCSSLQVLNDYGVAAGLTDVAIASGVYPIPAGEARYEYCKDNEEPVSLLDLHNQNDLNKLFLDPFGSNFGTMYTCSEDDGELVLISEHGRPLYTAHLNRSRYAIRPVISTDDREEFPIKNVQSVKLSSGNSVNIGECWAYPSSMDSEMTDRYLSNHSILNKRTGNRYTLNSNPVDSPLPFNPDIYEEYKIENNSYICLPAKRDAVFFSDFKQKIMRAGQKYLFKVLPLKWLVNESKNTETGKTKFTYICLRGILGNIPFDSRSCCYYPSYDKMFMSDYLKQYLFNEMRQSDTGYEIQNAVKTTKSETDLTDTFGELSRYSMV